MSRQFTEEEARRIFARAAERQHEAPTHSGVLSLEDLQSIGQEAGIDPDHIRAAIAEADATTGDVPTWLGMPLRFQESRQIDGPVSDAAWAEAVDRMRERFKVPGTLETIGERRRWQAMEYGVNGPSLTLTEEEGATVVAVDSGRGSQDVATYISLAMPGSLAVFGVLIGMLKDKPGGFALAAAMLILAVIGSVLSYAQARKRARDMPGTIRRDLDTIERLAKARAEEPRVEASAEQEPAGAVRMDVALLDDPEAPAEETPAERRRQRGRA
ncbi:MAG: hypothetical protein AAGK21_00265 [Bacteroidota bacterium]